MIRRTHPVVCVERTRRIFLFCGEQVEATMPKGSTWTQTEDETFCRAWLAAREDPITGTGQKKDTFWSSILRNFNSLLPANLSPTDRSTSSMQSRWAQINKGVTKFNALSSQVTSILRSRWTLFRVAENSAPYTLTVLSTA